MEQNSHTIQPEAFDDFYTSAKKHPVVPEPEIYGLIFISLSLLVVFLKRKHHGNTE